MQFEGELGHFTVRSASHLAPMWHEQHHRERVAMQTHFNDAIDGLDFGLLICHQSHLSDDDTLRQRSLRRQPRAVIPAAQ